MLVIFSDEGAILLFPRIFQRNKNAGTTSQSSKHFFSNKKMPEVSIICILMQLIFECTLLWKIKMHIANNKHVASDCKFAGGWNESGFFVKMAWLSVW